jgi:L-asparaginase
MSSARPRILVLSTGGTIAGEAASTSGSSYVAGKVGIDALLEAAGKAAIDADLSGKAVAAVGSQDMDRHIWARLYQEIERAFVDDTADGVVITHGTDTAEETAFLLDLTLTATKPVVIASAMRPANALGADGPRNLASAIRLAADPASHGRGVLLVMGDAIFAADSVYKASTTGTEAFAGFPGGSIGAATPSSGRFYHPSAPKAAPYPFPDVDAWPSVAILYAHADMDRTVVDAVLATKPAGIVLAGVGHGNGPSALLDRLAQAASGGVVVVRSSRVNAGSVGRDLEVDDASLGFIAGGTLNPQKCRILLQLLIANGITDKARQQRAFERKS